MHCSDDCIKKFQFISIATVILPAIRIADHFTPFLMLLYYSLIAFDLFITAWSNYVFEVSFSKK